MSSDTETIIEGREVAEWNWLETLLGIGLHHVNVTDEQAAELVEEAGLGRTTASCGLSFRQVWVPGALHRQSLQRCPGCCDAVGYPHGYGSPRNDETCRPLVERRLTPAGTTA